MVKLLEDFEENGAVFIVMEFCDGGEMFDTLQNHGAWDETAAKNAFRSFLQGVMFLHSMGVCHRDLSLENTLYHSPSGPKICDFGGCIRYAVAGIDGGLVVRDRLGRSQYIHSVGKPIYKSPQILARAMYDGKKTDLWSSGAFLFLLLTGHPPWETADPTMDSSGSFRRYLSEGPEGFKQQCQEWDLLRYFSDDSWDLLMRLVCVEEGQRMTAMECLDHPWLRESGGGGGGGAGGGDTGDQGEQQGEQGAAAETTTSIEAAEPARERLWTATSWSELTPDQQSRIRTLKSMMEEVGTESPAFQRALLSTVTRSGWTKEELGSVLGMDGTAGGESSGSGTERCAVM